MNYDDILARHFSTVTPSPNFEPDLLLIPTMEGSLELQDTPEVRFLLEIDEEMQRLTKRFKQQVRESYLSLGAVVISLIVILNNALSAFLDVKISLTDIADLPSALWLLLPLFTTLLIVTIDRRELKELP